MGKTTKAQEAAWEFLKFLSSEEGLLVQASFGMQMPAHLRLAESLKWVQQGRPPKTPKIMVEGLKYARPDYFTHWTGPAENALVRAINAIWAGETSPQAGARQAQDEAQAALDKAVQDPLWNQ
jgi:ABC-type glycerol-3-phosphate transport system substrate-binding protein